MAIDKEIGTFSFKAMFHTRIPVDHPGLLLKNARETDTYETEQLGSLEITPMIRQPLPPYQQNQKKLLKREAAMHIAPTF